MSTNEVGAPAQPVPRPTPGDLSGGVPGARGPRRLRGLVDRWPFRRKLNALVAVPLAAVTLLLTHLITDEAVQARDAEVASRLVRDSAQVAVLVDRVNAEHQQAILLSVRHEAAGEGAKPSISDYRKAQSAVDAQVEKVRDTFGDRLPRTEARALREIDGLSSLRETVEKSYLAADSIDPAYSNASDGLIDGLGLDHDEALAGTFTGNLLDSLLRADAAHGAYETAVFSARTGDSNAQIEFISAVGSANEYDQQAERFARFATGAQAKELSGIEHNSAQAAIGRHYAELQIDPSNLQADTPEETRKAFETALDSYPVYREQSETRLKITASLIDQIADRAYSTAVDTGRRTGILVGSALLGSVLWITFAVLVRRSVARPVQALTVAARQVAEVAGRELARVADDDAEDSAPPRLREVPVTVKDEIGDLAEAFNHVQSTASALLERQVLSRRNVAEMFGNVGRRVSNLTTRQLALIDAVERGETDPALLERLYSIDHIAVRLRRNADSLMLLAGIRETVLDSGPLALTNVVRAALGQIEGFQRVRLDARTEVMVEPDMIADLTLLVAELVENAVSFSPAGSPVEVTVRDEPTGALILVTDHGLGMGAERIAEENARLIRRERLDLVPTRVLGLFVVGALARRWELDVVLSRTPGGGVTAEVVIPASLLLTTKATATATTADASASASGGTPNGTAARTGHGRVPAEGAAPPADPAPLPRRVPRPGPAPDGIASAATSKATAPKGASTGAGAGTSDGPSDARPLRRRVRGATLPTTLGADPGQSDASRSAPRFADAEAVRAALDDFEAAVSRAHRDTTAALPAPRRPQHEGTATAPRADEPTPDSLPPHHQHSPEGAEP